MQLFLLYVVEHFKNMEVMRSFSVAFGMIEITSALLEAESRNLL